MCVLARAIVEVCSYVCKSKGNLNSVSLVCLSVRAPSGRQPGHLDLHFILLKIANRRAAPATCFFRNAGGHRRFPVRRRWLIGTDDRRRGGGRRRQQLSGRFVMRGPGIEAILSRQLPGTHVLQAGEVLQRDELYLGWSAGPVHQRRLFDLLRVVRQEEERNRFVVVFFV